MAAGRIDLAWTASTDNVAVAGYNVYRDAVKVDTVPIGSTSCSDTGIGGGVSHTYTVKAVDAAANESAASNTWSGAASSGALTTTYAYDPENRLTQLAAGGQTIGTYAYDGAGNRVGKTAGGASTAYTLDLASGLPQVLTETSGSSVTAYAYAGAPLEIDRSGTTNWYLSDTLGSVRLVPTLPVPAPPPTPTVPSAPPVPPQALSPTRSASPARGPIPSRVWSSSGPVPTTPPPAPSCSVTPGASPLPAASRSTPTSIPPTTRSTRSIRRGTTRSRMTSRTCGRLAGPGASTPSQMGARTCGRQATSINRVLAPIRRPPRGRRKARRQRRPCRSQARPRQRDMEAAGRGSQKSRPHKSPGVASVIENTPDSPVLSVGAINGSGPESYEWRMAMRPLAARVRHLREGVSSPLCVNVVYFIPGPTVQIDFEGVRTGSFSRAKRDLIVQAALPEQPALPYDEVLRALMVASIDAAEAFAKRRKIAESLPELRDLVGKL